MIALRTKNLVKVVLAIQLLVIWLIGSGVRIPILRQSVGFIYLSFIPGFLILRILRLQKLSMTETISYSIGLSLSSLMLMGITVNCLYPLIGISKPISEIPLVITTSMIVLLLYFICHFRDKDHSVFFNINSERILSPSVLFLSLLPFLAIFGAYLLAFYKSSNVLLILLLTLSLIPVLVAFDQLSQEIYPFAVWVISISLLFHVSLISTHVSNFGDADATIYYSQLVKSSNYWSVTLESNVKFTGFVGREDLKALYAACDIFVLPSFEEGFPIVLTEAMASGKSLTGMNVGGIPMQIRDGWNGFLVEPANEKQLAEKIKYLIDNPEERNNMGRNSRKLAEEEFSWEKIAERYLKVYEEVLNEQRKRS